MLLLATMLNHYELWSAGSWALLSIVKATLSLYTAMLHTHEGVTMSAMMVLIDAHVLYIATSESCLNYHLTYLSYPKKQCRGTSTKFADPTMKNTHACCLTPSPQ